MFLYVSLILTGYALIAEASCREQQITELRAILQAFKNSLNQGEMTPELKQLAKAYKQKQYGFEKAHIPTHDLRSMHTTLYSNHEKPFYDQKISYIRKHKETSPQEYPPCTLECYSASKDPETIYVKSYAEQEKDRVYHLHVKSYHYLTHILAEMTLINLNYDVNEQNIANCIKIRKILLYLE